VITTRDIAERLQLSVSTVGRALADDQRISDQTKFRVRQAAAEMGYVANRAARMMRGASSDVVGLVIPDIRNTFYSTVAHELSKNMGAQGFQLMLAETDDDKAVELGHLREMSASRVAGLIIVPTARPHGESVKLLRTIPHIQLLRKRPSLGAQWFGAPAGHSSSHRARTQPDRLHRRSDRTVHRGGPVDGLSRRVEGRPPAGRPRAHRVRPTRVSGGWRAGLAQVARREVGTDRDRARVGSAHPWRTR
jgi:hypothetical protein